VTTPDPGVPPVPPKNQGGRRGRDTVPGRLQRLVMTVLLLVILVGSLSVAGVMLATGNVTRLTTGYGPANDANAQSLSHMLDAEAALRAYRITHAAADLTRYRRARTGVGTDFTQLSHALASIDQHRFDAAIVRERSFVNRWFSGFADPLTATTPAHPAAVLAADQAMSVFDQYRMANVGLANELQKVRLSLRQDTVRLRKFAIITICAVSLAAIAVVAALGLRTASGIARPLAAVRTVLSRIDSADFRARANEHSGPDEVRTLARAVNALGDRSQADQAAEDIAEDLRQRTRLVSLAIRRIEDPQRLAQHLVSGLGDALAADRVLLHTFPDARVPPLTVQWQQPRLQPLADAVLAELQNARELADRLWDTARPVRIPDHSLYRPSPVGQLLSIAASDAGITASMVAPIGDTNTAFGLLWVGMTDHRRDWTSAEAGIVQHLAADAAHGLIQSNVLARNREVVERLSALDRAKADSVSTVSHELRTPLTSITGYLEMMADGDAGELPVEAQRMLAIIDRNAVRLRNLIEDLLTQSRIDAGRLRLNIERVMVHEVVERVQTTMRPLSFAADVKLQVHSVAKNVAVNADEPQLEQVLTNLLSNGIKFTPHGGSVTLEVQQFDDEVVLQVRDTGIGIPADEIPDLATRFFRASNAVAAAFAGTGLGLAIVAEIVERHGGTITFDSTEGAGTTVTVRLPAAEES
jgi:signal transduction histidine kinase/HAMP domain-containing protein